MPREWSRQTSWTIPTASCFHSAERARVGKASGSGSPGTTALEDIGTRIRKAIEEGRRHELMYHVGRPGEDGYANRVLQAWGVDGHNSHTNVCSSSARLGHFLWTGADRPSPDYANARTILLLSSHLETGHYFNPHAQRIVEAQAEGATLITIDPRLSNTAAKANLWLAPYPGTEGALLLAIARILIDEELYDHEFVRNWVNWRDYLRNERPDLPLTFDRFITALKDLYAQFTPDTPPRKPAWPPIASSRRRRPSPAPGTAFQRIAGELPLQVISGAGKSRAVFICWSSSPGASAASAA